LNPVLKRHSGGINPVFQTGLILIIRSGAGENMVLMVGKLVFFDFFQKKWIKTLLTGCNLYRLLFFCAIFLFVVMQVASLILPGGDT
jgi:hypothetical protein